VVTLTHWEQGWWIDTQGMVVMGKVFQLLMFEGEHPSFDPLWGTKHYQWQYGIASYGAKKGTLNCLN